MHNLFPKALTVFTLMLVLAAWNATAQQEPQFTQNMFNLSTINPANYGMSDAVAVTGLMREQWLGFKDDNGNKVAPETYVISADAPFRIIHGGVGLSIVQDKVGFFKDMYVKLGYSYHLTLGTGKLGIGANVSFLNKSVDFGDNLIAADPQDDVLKSLTNSKGVIFTDLSSGIFYKNPKLYLSASTTQMLQSARYMSKDSQKGKFYLRRHYYGTAGYNLTFPAYPGYVLTPSVFVKSDGSTLQADLNALVTYNQKVWGGVSYRLNETVALMVGFRFNDIEAGYSYDIPMTRISAWGSHEIMVRYMFKLEKEKVRSGYRNTRFL
ncbi:MAG: type IX secretion system membrane protein PorP/SprF [Bacteroidetes bacterium]|nr:type IX secretion system membrane protein PorP/SprF [Bacteroidota bacterium]